MKKLILSLVLISFNEFISAQVTTINITLDTPCASLSQQDSEFIDTIYFYPNPSSGFINIIEPSNLNAIKVFDLKGALVFEKIEFNSSRIDLSVLKNGLYLLNLEFEDKKSTKKLIINK